MITLQQTADQIALLRAESATEYSWTASGAPGLSSAWNARSAALGSARLRSR